MNSEDKAKLCYQALDDKKGINIKVIDISKISVMADYFIIASGSNIKQVQAISDNVIDKLSEKKIHPKQVEGYAVANWVLIDCEDVVVHVFDKDSRDFYDLERIWQDGKYIDF